MPHRLLRDLLLLTSDVPRFHRGRDQHLPADHLIRLAQGRVQHQAPLDGDEVIAAMSAGFTHGGPGRLRAGISSLRPPWQ